MTDNVKQTTLAECESSTPDSWEEELFGSFAAGSDTECDNVEEGELSTPIPSQDLLSALQALGDVPTADATEPPSLEGKLDAVPKVDPIAPARLGNIESDELREAFLQDASRGIAALETAVIQFESQEDMDGAVSQIARELHTLKGAAATVGLEDIARYIHDIENFAARDSPQSLFATTMFECVDTLRRQADALSGGNDQPQSASLNSSLGGSADGDDSICVKASQLDRLMDMLTALVMLRNQRESRVEQLRNVNSELAQCGTRVRAVERQLMSSHTPAGQLLKDRSNPLAEVANDLAEVGRKLGESYGPVSEENLAVSKFIRQFRQALVQLLRTPVSGLFLRLQRAALEAARVEGKQVRLQIAGADVGLERSIQERLFDPLLHIVRNAVGHGIETPEQRKEVGKDPVGTITLEAAGAPNLLILTIRDDGRGLDYEALRRRGIELGILTGDRKATPQELAQLIFRPGFSTRKAANEVAGRGIGMDVVADTLDRMHSWVEVDSIPSQGTTVTLTVPLRSIIDHVMVVGAAGQLFALPMQFVKQSEVDADANNTASFALERILGMKSLGSHDKGTNGSLIVETRPTLTQSSSEASIAQDSCGRINLSVNEVVGTEEVVIRPLPPLFRHQNLFSGVTLASDGRIVLVLDPRRLVDTANGLREAAPDPVDSSTEDGPEILIVDDSLSARRHAEQAFVEGGWSPRTAANGKLALDLVRKHCFSAIVTDFDMPGMDGLQLVKALKSNQDTREIPVFMLSSRPKEDREAAALDAGVARYFRKPLSRKDIEDISTLLTQQSEDN